MLNILSSTQSSLFLDLVRTDKSWKIEQEIDRILQSPQFNNAIGKPLPQFDYSSIKNKRFV